MESLVIGTAGHIDHGKTTLVKALTGRDTDTLAEEQRRGITISPGFAYFTLPCGKTAGIVDVPGHERLIKNMLAGASGIDIAMLVVAANEGVMPQTREHVNILRYLDIQEAVVVLTKIGMVEEDFKELVLEDTKDYLQTTCLRNAPIFQVDSLAGEGVDALVNYLDNLAKRTKKPKSTQAMRLNVDRVFSSRGFGTIVTGTLTEGTVKTEDSVTVYPKNIISKVRGLQIHEQSVPVSTAGQRTAINLSGISVQDISRGDVVAKPGSVFVSSSIDVRLSLLEEANAPIRRAGNYKLYIGTSEVLANIVPLSGKSIQPGDESYAQILLKTETPVRRGDRFVIRTLTPVSTVGGGMVIDPAPRRYRKITDEILLSVQKKDDSAQMLPEFIKTNPFLKPEALALLLNTQIPREQFQILTKEGSLIEIDGMYLHKDYLEEVRKDITRLLKAYHAEYPLRRGIMKMELFSKQKSVEDIRQFDLLLKLLSESEDVQLNKACVAVYGFLPAYTSEQLVLKREMEEAVQEAGYTPLTAKELTQDSKDREQMLESLLEESFLMLGSQVVFDRSLYQNAKEQAIRLNQETGSVKLSEFRDAIQTSRKYALLILDQFDKEKFTKRIGEDRTLL